MSDFYNTQVRMLKCTYLLENSIPFAYLFIYLFIFKVASQMGSQEERLIEGWNTSKNNAVIHLLMQWDYGTCRFIIIRAEYLVPWKLILF